MQLNLLTLLSAIATQEGFFVPGSVPAQCANPGDLRFAGQNGSKPSKFGGPLIPIAEFDSLGRGTAANLRQICLRIQEGLTLRQLIETTWAPAGDGANNPELYLAETLRRIKAHDGIDLDPDVKIWEYLPLEKII